MIRPLILAALLVTPVASLADPPAAPASINCTDVTVGSAHGYDCLNAQLANIAHATQRPSSDTNAPVSATSPSNVVGTFNESGTRNRLGANFGKSVQPFRPTVTYLPPLTGGAPR